MLRVPNLWEPYWYGDEGIYLTVGQSLKNGMRLYSEIIDHKTPFIYWVSEVAYTLTNLKLLLVLVSVTVVTLFYFLSLKLFEKNNPWFFRISFLAFSLLTTLPALEGNIFNGELLLMPFILMGVLWFWHLLQARKTTGWHWLLTGSFFGLAVLTKVPSGFDFVAIGIFYILYVLGKPKRLWPKYIKQGLLLIGGFVIPLLLSVVYFALLGDLNAYLDFGLLYNFRYIQSWGLPFNHPLLQWLVSMQGRLILLTLFIAGLIIIKNHISVQLQFILIWFGLTLFAALLSLRPYPHYALQLVPPAALLMGYFASTRFIIRAGILTLLMMSYGLWIVLGFRPYPTYAYYENFAQLVVGIKPEEEYRLWFDKKIPTVYELSEYLRNKTEFGERVFIWGNEPMVYALSRRPPLGRFIVHIESFEGAKSETMQNLDKFPPRYIVVTRNDRGGFSEFFDWLEERYRIDTNIGYAAVFKRKVEF